MTTDTSTLPLIKEENAVDSTEVKNMPSKRDINDPLDPHREPGFPLWKSQVMLIKRRRELHILRNESAAQEQELPYVEQELYSIIYNRLDDLAEDERKTVNLSIKVRDFLKRK